MIKFAAGFMVGVMVATIGFSNVAKVADNTLQKYQSVLKENAQ